MCGINRSFEKKNIKLIEMFHLMLHFNVYFPSKIIKIYPKKNKK